MWSAGMRCFSSGWSRILWIRSWLGLPFIASFLDLSLWTIQRFPFMKSSTHHAQRCCTPRASEGPLQACYWLSLMYLFIGYTRQSVNMRLNKADFNRAAEVQTFIPPLCSTKVMLWQPYPCMTNLCNNHSFVVIFPQHRSEIKLYRDAIMWYKLQHCNLLITLPKGHISALMLGF